MKLPKNKINKEEDNLFINSKNKHLMIHKELTHNRDQ